MRATDPDIAAQYVGHITIGDPEAVVEALAGIEPHKVRQFIQAGMEQNAKTLADAPKLLLDLFEHIEQPPTWFDPEVVEAGCRAFHKHSDLFLAAFIGESLVRGFATLISKSFVVTGQVIENGITRLKNNLRQLVKIMLPGGLDRQGEGWKLSVRIRLVHAQARRLIRVSDLWDEAVYSMPLSIAHILFGSAAFSAILLQSARKLGARLTAQERASFMHIWRYSALLIGVPETILWRNEAEALNLYRVGTGCEPPPSVDSILMANTRIHSAPSVVGIQDKDEQQNLSQYIYRVSRALIGEDLADKLDDPYYRTGGMLFLMHWQYQIQNAIGWFIPSLGQKRRSAKFEF